MSNELYSDRSKVKRLGKRGNYDLEKMKEILDEAFLCHVACDIGNGPVIIPICYGRIDNVLYFHGAITNRILNLIGKGQPACVEVTHMDALVLARSAFHHSMNYRSVVLFGKGYAVTDEKENLAALKAITENIIPGRWDEVREPSKTELKGTLVVGFPIEEGSSKIRTGPPVDNKEDYSLDIWAGEIPLKQIASPPIPDALNKADVNVSPSILNFLNHNQ